MNDEVTLDDLLLAHAAGRLPEPLALLVRWHVALVPESRDRLRLLEMLGGVVLERMPPQPLERTCRERVLACLDGEPAVDDPPRASCALPSGLDRLEWRECGDVAEAALPSCEPAGLFARILRIRPGCCAGRHGHAGREFVLVLEGGFRDEYGHYRRGDLVICDPRIEHAPVADPDRPCLCLEVREEPAAAG